MGLAQQIIAEELRQTNRDSMGQSRPSAWSEADELLLQQQLGREAYIELMQATEATLIAEELESGHGSGMAADEEYEAFLEAEAAQLAAEAEAAHMTTDGVMCPLCVRSTLVVDSNGWIVCGAAGGGCGLRLDARGHPAPLELLRARMDALLTEHGQRCRGQASCRLPAPAEAPIGHLLFCCPACGTVVGVV